MSVLSRVRRHPILLAAASSLCLLSTPLVNPVSGVAAASGTSAVSAPVFTPALTLFGTVDLSSLGPPPAPKSTSATASRRRVEDQAVVSHRPTAGAAASTPSATGRTVTGTQVPKEYGFVGLTGAEQAAANGGLDLEPPDQGLCAGDGYVTEFVNNALTVYNRAGSQALPVIPSYELFKQPSTAFFSDPRCYFDAATGHWFLSEFIVGTVGSSGTVTSPSVQFLAVSDTSDPLGTYHVWGWDTTDQTTAGCPCFGDYDELGADDNGIYITTDEFSITGPAYNGVIVYALSKELIETYSSSGIPPTVFGYRVTHDYFGQPYILAPTTTPAGARFAPGTEYFVESNGNALSDDHLAVYALHDTSELAAPSPPSLYRTEVTSEPYAFPPDANQKPGPRPLGRAVQDPEGMLQADFDSVMETTYVNGHIYGELDTATTSGYDAAAWFQLTPVLSGSTLTASVYRQGYVAAAHANLIYPYTALSSKGTGYLLFSLSGPDNYPSAAYITYASSGPSGPVRIAGAGAEPEDGFTCYAAFVGPNYGGCRWGDYSMGAAANGVV
ncbi:MAG TPA: hypothetical protein VKU91_05395, partial [Acidimicrobiales bacterium]|nr:hypothetical protein [Acidimicrobiales bacterium]